MVQLPLYETILDNLPFMSKTRNINIKSAIPAFLCCKIDLQYC
jgi:hypothetical protein